MNTAGNLDSIAERARQALAAKDEAREKTLPLCRDTIRHCSETIRALHRREFEQAAKLLLAAKATLDEACKAATPYAEFSHSGFMMDAQKEFAEANIVLALITAKPLPEPEDLAIDVAPYLNGMAEAASEIRRYLLDGMRHGDLTRGEELLTAMDDVYSVLITMDFPDAITGGLRRTTDALRAVLERTRSDLTLAIEQKNLENRIGKLEERLR